MTNKTGLTLFAAGLLAATILVAPCAPSVAQERAATSTDFSAQQQKKKELQKKAAPAPRRTVTQPKATQRTVTQPKATQRTIRQPKATPKVVTQPKTTPKVVTQPKTTPKVVTQPKATPKVVAPAATVRKVVSPAAAPKVVTPRGKQTVTAKSLKGVPASGVRSAVVSGHNYSAWRSGHRVRRGGGWRTFVALSALSAIIIGSNDYYPYAYISAPEPYCEGLTEDGCQLMWQEVETLEGDVINQCVAYCPWR